MQSNSFLKYLHTELTKYEKSICQVEDNQLHVNEMTYLLYTQILHKWMEKSYLETSDLFKDLSLSVRLSPIEIETNLFYPQLGEFGAGETW